MVDFKTVEIVDSLQICASYVDLNQRRNQSCQIHRNDIIFFIPEPEISVKMMRLRNITKSNKSLYVRKIW
jgi:hypothetical protein